MIHDARGEALLGDDLRSTCTEEIAVFQVISKAVLEAGYHFVVMDTAPMGLTMMPLDATGSWHRDIIRCAEDDANVVTPTMRLQDRHRTRTLLVPLPDTRPRRRRKRCRRTCAEPASSPTRGPHGAPGVVAISPPGSTSPG